MNCILTYLLIGGGLGALFGRFNRRCSGEQSLTTNWKRGAIYGALVATLFYSVSGCGFDSAAMNQSTANVTHITDTNFDAEVTQSSEPVVVDCYATWCAPCRRLAPIVDSMADEFAGKIKFVKVNIDESPKTAQKFHVQGIPMLLFFKNGRLTDSTLGVLDKSELAGRLDDLLATNVPPAAPKK